MKILLFSFLLIFSLNNLDKCDRGNHDDQTYANLDETIDLPMNESVTIKSEKLKVSFESNADSRCPKGVNCIHAGKAKVSLKLTKDEKDESLELSVKGLCHKDDGSCGSEGSAQGYTIKLLNIYPYPSDPKPEESQPTYAKIVVSKE